VLHCIAGFDGGGAQRQLAYLAGGLASHGIDVHIAHRGAGPNIGRVQDRGVALHTLIRSPYDPRLVWELVRIIRKVRPHLIQTWLTQMDVAGGMAALITRTPFIITERSSADAYNGTWKDRLRIRIGGKANAVVANSNSGTAYWLAQRRRSLITVIPNGVPVGDIQASPSISSQTRGLHESTEVLLFAGRYSAEKNLSILLDAVFRVVSARPNLVAVFLGQGPLKDELVAKVERHGMAERVWISDYTSELWAWMRRANLFVSVSAFEGSPNAVIEAAVQGCPLVLSDIRQHTELLGKDAAVFVPTASPDAIAAGILEVLSDEGIARSKAQRARERASRLTVESMVRRYAELYQHVLGYGVSV